jgi:hypothetical protein
LCPADTKISNPVTRLSAFEFFSLCLGRKLSGARFATHLLSVAYSIATTLLDYAAARKFCAAFKSTRTPGPIVGASTIFLM